MTKETETNIIDALETTTLTLNNVEMTCHKYDFKANQRLFSPMYADLALILSEKIKVPNAYKHQHNRFRYAMKFYNDYILLLLLLVNIIDSWSIEDKCSIDNIIDLLLQMPASTIEDKIYENETLALWCKNFNEAAEESVKKLEAAAEDKIEKKK